MCTLAYITKLVSFIYYLKLCFSFSWCVDFCEELREQSCGYHYTITITKCINKMNSLNLLTFVFGALVFVKSGISFKLMTPSHVFCNDRKNWIAGHCLQKLLRKHMITSKRT